MDDFSGTYSIPDDMVRSYPISAHLVPTGSPREVGIHIVVGDPSNSQTGLMVVFNVNDEPNILNTAVLNVLLGHPRLYEIVKDAISGTMDEIRQRGTIDPADEARAIHEADQALALINEKTEKFK